MSSLENRLNKMLNDYKDIGKESEKLFDKTMSDIDNLKNKKDSEFLKESLTKAKAGKLNVNDFLKDIENLKK